jgi:hypothetical protein
MHSLLLKGLSGKLGKELVVKKYGDKIVLSKYPDMSLVKTSPLQKLKRARFAEAMKYAQEQLRTEEGRTLYATRATASKRALNVAMSDFYHAPKVKHIDLRAFKGKEGDFVFVQAEDDFQVVNVEMHIYFVNNVLVEQGGAALNKKGWWEYRIKNAYPDLIGLKLKATAWDRPRNEGSLEVGL